MVLPLMIFHQIQLMVCAVLVGVMVLPLMIFHQIQLMVCAVLARRYREQEALPQVQEG